MRRREFIALAGASVTWPFAAMAQQAGRAYRIGLLQPVPRDTPPLNAFLDELRSFGFIEGQNLIVEYRDYGAHPDLISKFAADLVNAQVDAIGAAGDPGIRAAQEATRTIPIVGFTDDMAGSGFVNSIARPNGNITGVNLLAAELNGKRQEILIEAVPGLRRMAALADTNNNTTAPEKLHALQEAARERNVELSIHQIGRGEEIAAAIDSAQASGATALNVLSSPILYTNRRLIIDRVASIRMPAIYQFPEQAEEGGFIGYGPNIIQISREITSRLLAKVLRGTKIADLPIEQPTKFELVINLKTAKAMGVTVPEALLVRADKVIE
jgi:putative tryptophan/tyrosine transport system substrate-binding protein